MTRSEATRAAAARLRAAGLPTPELDARSLACEAFGIALSTLVADGGATETKAALRLLEGYVTRRLAGEPVARIRGRREFWGLDFALDAATLVPRPDTETLVEAALETVGRRDGAFAILDLGTGSGCLLLALLTELPNAFGVGVDRSLAAVATARGNAATLGLSDRAGFFVGDWGAALSRRFGLVVSNPPYIPRDDIEALDREVRDFDPKAALDGGQDGLDAYRAILADLHRLLDDADGIAVLELGAGQVGPVSTLAASVGFAVSRVVADLAGAPRALVLEADRGGEG